MTLANGSNLNTSTGGGGGRGGDLRLVVNSLTVSSGAFLDAATINSGRGGNTDIQATDILLTRPRSGIKSPTLINGQGAISGDGGDISIQAGRLVIQDGAKIVASTEAQDASGNPDPVAAATGKTGKGGTIDIQSKRLRLTGTSGAAASILSQTVVQTPGTGSGGDISIRSTQVQIDAFGQINAGTTGSAAGGTVNIRAKTFKLAGPDSLVAASATGDGAAGSIAVKASRELTLNPDASVTVSADHSDAGDLTLNGGPMLTINRSLVSAKSGVNGGDIKLVADQLSSWLCSAGSTPSRSSASPSASTACSPTARWRPGR